MRTNLVVAALVAVGLAALVAPAAAAFAVLAVGLAYLAYLASPVKFLPLQPLYTPAVVCGPECFCPVDLGVLDVCPVDAVSAERLSRWTAVREVVEACSLVYGPTTELTSTEPVYTEEPLVLARTPDQQQYADWSLDELALADCLSPELPSSEQTITSLLNTVDPSTGRLYTQKAVALRLGVSLYTVRKAAKAKPAKKAARRA